MHNQVWQAVCGYLVDACEELTGRDFVMRDIFHMICRNGSARCASWLEGRSARTMTYAEMQRRTAAVARRIDQMIPADGRRVALHMANAPEWPLLFWGLLMTGHAPLLLDAGRPIAHFEKALGDNGVVSIITREEIAGAISPVSLTRGAGEADEAPFADRWANEAVFLTSGTTGDACLLVYDGNCLAGQLRSCRYFYRETRELMYPAYLGPLRQLALLPFSHIFGFTICVLWYPFFGKEIVYPPSLSLKVLVDVCHRFEVTHLCAVPRVYDHFVRGAADVIRRLLGRSGEQLLKWLYGAEVTDARELARLRSLAQRVRERMLGKSMRYMISGGAQLSPVTATFLNRVGFCFCNGYGMTELGVVAVEMSTDENIRAEGAIGRPFHGVTFTASDTGELLVDCEYAARGWLEAGQVRPLPRPFPTRDQAKFRPDGRVVLVGRADDIIIDRDGNRLHPGEIEYCFRHITGIDEVCVVQAGEKLALVMGAASPPGMADLSQAVAAGNAGLPLGYRVHAAWLTDALPRTAKQEIDRRRIAALYQAGGLPGELVPISTGDTETVVMDDTMHAIRRKIAQLLNLPEDQVALDADFVTELGGDSLLYVTLMSWLEEFFGISLEGENYEALSTVLRCTAMVKNKRRTKGK